MFPCRAGCNQSGKGTQPALCACRLTVEEARYYGYSQVHFENAFALRICKVAYHAFTSQHIASRHGNVAKAKGNYRNVAPEHSREIGRPSLRKRIPFATPHYGIDPPQLWEKVWTQGAGKSRHGDA